MPERLLMIEDDESLAAMVAEYLGSLGFEVTTHVQVSAFIWVEWHIHETRKQKEADHDQVETKGPMVLNGLPHGIYFLAKINIPSLE